MPRKKCTETIPLHIDEQLKRDIQCVAERERRDMSEWLRIVIEDVLYGRLARIERPPRESERR